MMGTPDILHVSGGRMRRQFLELPFRLYRGDPNWVPPLRSAQARTLAGKTAFFDHSEMALFMAFRDGMPVARVAAIVNRAHNEHYKDRTGFFGFFECAPEDVEATRVLFARAGTWLRQRGMTSIRGPMSPSMSSECGVLLEGFDSPPMPLMAHNPPSYAKLLESAGFRKCKDLFAYVVKAEDVVPGTEKHDRLIRISTIMKRRHPDIRLRSLNMKDYEGEVRRFMNVFDEARKENWGYVPATEDELLETARGLRTVIDPQIIVIAETEDGPAGVGLGIPNFNPGLAAVGGRLFPFGFIRFFKELRRTREIRVFGVAALPKFRTMGITALILTEIIIRGHARGYRRCEASWVLEDNVMSARTIVEALNAERYKTYRLYEKPIVGV